MVLMNNQLRRLNIFMGPNLNPGMIAMAFGMSSPWSVEILENNCFDCSQAIKLVERQISNAAHHPVFAHTNCLVFYYALNNAIQRWVVDGKDGAKINPKDVAVFYCDGKKWINLMDYENAVIDLWPLEKVFNELSEEYDNLLDEEMD